MREAIEHEKRLAGDASVRELKSLISLLEYAEPDIGLFSVHAARNIELARKTLLDVDLEYSKRKKSTGFDQILRPET